MGMGLLGAMHPQLLGEVKKDLAGLGCAAADQVSPPLVKSQFNVVIISALKYLLKYYIQILVI